MLSEKRYNKKNSGRGVGEYIQKNQINLTTKTSAEETKDDGGVICGGTW